MILGMNFAGGFENIDETSKQWLKDLGKVAIRIPGGAISRFHNPFTNRKGWGMTEESINTFFDLYGDNLQSDEDSDGGRDSWLRKMSAQPDRSYMDDLIALQAEMPELEVIYVANVFTSTTDEQFNAIKYMIDGGVKVKVVEFGNEVYGKYEFNTTDYIATCEPLVTKLHTSFPDVKLSMISGNFKGRRDHEQWNNQLATYVNDASHNIDYVTLHFYIGDDIAPEAYAALPAPKIVDYSQVDSQLLLACNNYTIEVLTKNRLQEEVDMAKAIYNTGIIITEWNNNPAQKWCNTLVNSQWIFTQFASLEDVDYLCLHNGISPDIYGMICLSKQQDGGIPSENGLLKRLSYYALKLANEIDFNVFGNVDASVDYTINFITSEGTYYIPFAGVYDGEYTELELSEGYKIDSISARYIKGNYPYSSCGVTGFQSKNQPANYEISDITETVYPTSTLSLDVPMNSFGYFKIVASKENKLPVADAGKDTTYTVSNTNSKAIVELNASSSFDEDGAIVRYSWYKDGLMVSMDPVFTTTLPIGTYTYKLVVTDNDGGWAEDTVVITVKKKRGSFWSFLNVGKFNGSANKNNI